MLKYVGDGSWLAGIPARDLTDEEVEVCGGEKFLLASKLYEKPRGTVSVARPAESKQDDKELK